MDKKPTQYNCYRPVPKHMKTRQTKQGVPCPKCGSGRTAVFNTRPFASSLRRHRCCLACTWWFMTFEFEEMQGDPIDRYEAVLANAPKMVEQLVRLERAARLARVAIDGSVGELGEIKER